jgi:hypothetical protein
MPESYYPNVGEDEPTEKPEATGNEDSAEVESALIPKSLLGGKEFKPGDEISLKVLHIYEDEVEVEYSKEEPETEEPEEPATMGQGPGAGPGMTYEAELDQMSKE